MDQQFQTSFIPKKPVAEMEKKSEAYSEAGHNGSTGGSILGFLTTLVFVGAIVSAGGMYFYYYGAQKKIVDMTDQIQKAAKAYDTSFIAEMQATDKRLRSATTILSSHIIVSPIFQALGELTLKTVAFNNFDYSFNTKGEVVVTMKGKAVNYEAIALQSDMLSTNRFIKDPVFSNLNLDDKGNVTFELNFIVDRSFVNYIDDIDREKATTPEIEAPIDLDQLPANLQSGEGVPAN